MKSLVSILSIYLVFQGSLSAQIDPDSTKSGKGLPPYPTFYDVMNLMKEEAKSDSSEGGFYAQIKKVNELWAEPLFPYGEAAYGAQGIIEYAKNFNTNGMGNCTNGSWQCLGPSNRLADKPGCTGCSSFNHSGTGQIHFIKFSPTYTTDKIVYAGSGWSGVFKSQNDQPWQVLNTDLQLAMTSVSDLEIEPNMPAESPHILYISTGDGEMSIGHHAQNHDGTPSVATPVFTAGVYRSTNGGTTWTSINGPNQALLDEFIDGGTIRKIVLHPSVNSKEMFIATSRGVFKTPDRTVATPTWQLSSSGIPVTDTELKGLVFKPFSTNTLFASGRDIYKSTNNGVSWTSMTGAGTGLNLAGLANGFSVLRINIAVTTLEENIIYAYIIGKDNVGPCAYIFKFGGTTWQQIGLRYSGYWVPVTPSRSAIVASSSVLSKFYFGSDVLMTNNSTSTGFVRISEYADANFHADVHALAFEPGTTMLFAGTDGGVHKKDITNTTTGGITNISNGLSNKTIYRFDDSDNRADGIMIGNQDTGTDIYDAGAWNIVYGGDGYNGKVDARSNLAFGSSSANTLFSYDFKAKKLVAEFTGDDVPKEPNPNFATINARMRGTFQMKNRSSNDEHMFFSMTELYERLKNAQTTSSDNASTLWKYQSDISRYYSSNYDDSWWRRQITEFDISESNPNYMLIAVSGGVVDGDGGFIVEPKLFRTTTGGCNGTWPPSNNPCFTDITANLVSSGISTGSYVPISPNVPAPTIPVMTSVVFHPENHNKAWVTFTGYEPSVKVWYTTDAGNTWQNADPNGSLHNIPVNDIVFQRGSNERLYIATDAGIYYKDAAMTDWKKFCDFPNVRVTELKINYCIGKLRAATFGRSVWEGNLVSHSGLGNSELVISGTTPVTWNNDRGMDRNIRIKPGAKLIIQGTQSVKTVLSMPKYGKIIIEPGGRLDVVDAVITNGCGNMWTGIEVWGNLNLPQTAANQGYLYLNRGKIEHARNAVAVWESLNYNRTGGMVYAYDSEFKNNKRSVEYIKYENKNASNQIINNVGYFSNCTFNIDNNYRGGSDLFQYHVSMWQVRGIKFYGCTFELNISHDYQEDRYLGIKAIDATFFIHAACLSASYPCTNCKRSVFKGFNKAIRTARTLDTYTFRVEETDFDNNIFGIETTAHNSFTVRACTFKIGKSGIPNAPACHEGITIYSGTGFTIDQNTLEPKFTSAEPKTVGIRAKDTGSEANLIYNNNFKKAVATNPNLFYANLANNINRSASPTTIGLQYKCNENTNNGNGGYDFAVVADISANEGIASGQGSLSSAAMNRFNNSTLPPTLSDFNNGALSGFINYYYHAGTANHNPLPSETFQVNKFSAPVGACPDNFSTCGMSEIQYPPAAISLPPAGFGNALDAAVQQLQQNLDGGNTLTLAKSVLDAKSGDSETLKQQLSDLAPFVSSTVLKAVAHRLDIFDKETIVELLTTNPDAAKEGIVQQMLLDAGYLTKEECAAIQLAAAENITARTELESQISDLATPFYQEINQNLGVLMQADGYLREVEIEAWLRKKESLEAVYALIELYIGQGRFTLAKDYLENLHLHPTASAQEPEEIEYFILLKNQQISWMEKGKTLVDIEPSDITLLESVANNSKRAAGDQARALLNLVFEYQYYVAPLFPSEQTGEERSEQDAAKMESKPQDASSLQVFPNPANKSVTLEFNVGEEYPDAEILVRNSNGRVVRRFDLLTASRQIQWDVRALPSGIYAVALEYKGKVIVSKKVTIAH